MVAFLRQPGDTGFYRGAAGGFVRATAANYALFYECCCPAPDCCECAAFQLAEEMCAVITGDLTGSGTLPFESIHANCNEFREVVTVTDSCGSEIGTLDINIRCPDVSTSINDIDTVISPDSGTCDIIPVGDPVITCDGGVFAWEQDYQIIDIADCACIGGTFTITITSGGC